MMKFLVRLSDRELVENIKIEVTDSKLRNHLLSIVDLMNWINAIICISSIVLVVMSVIAIRYYPELSIYFFISAILLLWMHKIIAKRFEFPDNIVPTVARNNFP